MTKKQKTSYRENAEFLCKLFKTLSKVSDEKVIIPTPEEVMLVWEQLDAKIGSDIRAKSKGWGEQERADAGEKVFDLLLQLLENLRSVNKKYTPMPTGSAINTIVNAINAGQNGQQGLDEWLTRKNRISHSKDTVTRGDVMNGDEGKIIYQHNISGERGCIKLKMPESIFNELVGHSVAPKKIMTFLFEKINTQAFHDRQLTRNYVDFSARELIERGVYTTRQTALKGLKAAMNILTGIQIEGEYHFGKDNTVSYTSSNEGGNIFRFWQHDKGQWRVYIEEHADWRFIFQSFSRLPTFYYRLPARASELLYLISAMERQRTEDIKERGYFTISFRLIQQVLNLPNEDKTAHPQRDIKDAINSAIDAIDNEYRKDFNDEDMFFLSAEYDEAWPIKQFLNEGFLHVALSGTFAQPFIDIENDRIKGLKEVKRKKQKILSALTEDKKVKDGQKKNNESQEKKG